MSDMPFEFPEFADLSMPERLKNLRLHHGWSREEMSAQTGGFLTANTIETVEMNRTRPNADQVLMFCRVLRVSPNYVLTGCTEYFHDAPYRKSGPVDFSEVMVWLILLNQLPEDYRRVLKSMAYDVAVNRQPEAVRGPFTKFLEYLDEVELDASALDLEDPAGTLDRVGEQLERKMKESGLDDALNDSPAPK